MKITEKVAYIKGLADGLPLDKTTNEGKILAAMIEALEELAYEVEEVTEDVATLSDYIEEVDEDLGAVEEEVYGCDCDCDCDDDCDCGCVEVECPNCKEVICLDDSVDLDHVICPACGEEFACEIEDECDCCCDDDDCDCDCCGDKED